MGDDDGLKLMVPVRAFTDEFICPICFETVTDCVSAICDGQLRLRERRRRQLAACVEHAPKALMLMPRATGQLWHLAQVARLVVAM